MRSQQRVLPPGLVCYEHPRLGEVVEAAAGHYVLTGERIVSYRGKALLVVIGYGLADRSCCGFMGCGYVYVAGYVARWKCRRSTSGNPVSLVAPITDAGTRQHIEGWVRSTFCVSQVRFDPPWMRPCNV